MIMIVKLLISDGPPVAVEGGGEARRGGRGESGESGEKSGVQARSTLE